MPVFYTASERFDPDSGESWAKYVNWSGLVHLVEVVSLDIMLCPTLFKNLEDEDWLHNVQTDCLIHLFLDLDYVIRRAAGRDRTMILAVVQNPTAFDITSFIDARFEFKGFDLMDQHTATSALVNCGGFEEVFANGDLSGCGLLRTHSEAANVQARLREKYPHELHADCNIWAIWRMAFTKA